MIGCREGLLALEHFHLSLCQTLEVYQGLDSQFQKLRTLNFHPKDSEQLLVCQILWWGSRENILLKGFPISRTNISWTKGPVSGSTFWAKGNDAENTSNLCLGLWPSFVENSDRLNSKSGSMFSHCGFQVRLDLCFCCSGLLETEGIDTQKDAHPKTNTSISRRHTWHLTHSIFP